MFYCKSSTQTSCSDVHWNFWRMCNALRLGSKVCDCYRLAISPIWRRRSTIKCLKKSSLYSAFCTQPAFYSQSAVCILLLVCILALVHSLQSAVCSLQSAFYTDRFFCLLRTSLMQSCINVVDTFDKQGGSVLRLWKVHVASWQYLFSGYWYTKLIKALYGLSTYSCCMEETHCFIWLWFWLCCLLFRMQKDRM